MSNANPPALVARLPRARGWIGLIALALYALFLARNFANVAGGADSSGYLNSARLLAAGHFTTDLRMPAEFKPQFAQSPQLFNPHGLLPFGDQSRLAPTYPAGLPLHLAAAGKLLGWSRAAPAVGLLAALGALALMYATAREIGLAPSLAMGGVVMLAAYPVFLFTSFQPLSDTLATTWCLAAVYTALRARVDPAWALACGAALAIAVLVRATNVLLLPALLVLLGLDARRLGLAVLGGIPGALWLAYYNFSLYGGVLRSGYVNLDSAFAWAHVTPTLLHFAQWLALLLPAALLPLAGVTFANPGMRNRVLLALAAWFFAFMGLYAAYEISKEVWWGLRFILPGTPPLILAGLLGVEALVRHRGSPSAARIRLFAATALAIWAVGLGWFWTKKYHLLLIKTYEQTYADAAAAARAQFPSNALVVAGQYSGALYYYTPFAVLRWDAVTPAEFAALQALATAAQRPLFAVLFDIEEQGALQERCRGDWRQIGSVRNTSLWQLAPAAVAAHE